MEGETEGITDKDSKNYNDDSPTDDSIINEDTKCREKKLVLDSEFSFGHANLCVLVNPKMY